MVELEVLSVVSLTEDFSQKGLKRGQVGIIVEILAPGIYEVEFSDDLGHAYAMGPVQSSALMRLLYEPRHEAA